MLWLDETEDVLNSRIGLKTLGFVPGKINYHDNECLLWVSEKNKELRTVCQLCQEIEDIEGALDESKGNTSTGSGPKEIHGLSQGRNKSGYGKKSTFEQR